MLRRTSQDTTCRRHDRSYDRLATLTIHCNSEEICTPPRSPANAYVSITGIFWGATTMFCTTQNYQKCLSRRVSRVRGPNENVSDRTCTQEPFRRRSCTTVCVCKDQVFKPQALRCARYWCPTSLRTPPEPWWTRQRDGSNARTDGVLLSYDRTKIMLYLMLRKTRECSTRHSET